MELDYFLRSDLRPIWSEVGSCMVDSVGLIAPASQPPLLCYGVLPVLMRGPPPRWGGESTPRRLWAAATSPVSTCLPGSLTGRAHFLLNMLSGVGADAATNSALTSAFTVGAPGFEPGSSVL